MADIETQFSAAHDSLEDWTRKKTDLNEDRIALEARIETIAECVNGSETLSSGIYALNSTAEPLPAGHCASCGHPVKSTPAF